MGVRVRVDLGRDPTRGGALHRVEAGNLEPDEDLLSLDGVSYQSPEARVVAVYDAHMPFNKNKVAAVFQRVLEEHEAAKRAKERTAEA